MKTIVPCSACLTINRVDLQKAENAKAICANCKQQLPLHDNVQDVSGKTLSKLIANAELPVVVDFWASWCGPCKMFAPTFIATAKTMSDKIIFAKFNTEEDDAGSNAYRIQAIPTLIVFNNGVEVDRQSGAMSPGELKKYLANVVST